jgi:RNA polymerase sigma-70 factor (ECF subfamily)
VQVTAPADFETFFRDEHPKLVALGMAMSGDREVGRELAQEALMRSFREWDRVRNFDRPGAWVRRVLVNIAIDAARSRGSEQRAMERLEPSAVVLIPDPVADGWWRAVLALPDRQRAAVALHYLDGLPVGEVAAILGITRGTVKASLAHARANLARQLRPADEDGET